MELGSEYHLSLKNLSVVENHLFEYLKPFEYTMFASGRQALACVPLPEKEVILLPEYVCESVIQAFSKYKVDYYRVNRDFSVDMQDIEKKIKSDLAAVVVIHYFGKMQSKGNLQRLRELTKERGAVLIEDTTQSLFSSRQLIADYGVSSIRKWMPIPMGGLLYTTEGNLSGLPYFEKSTDNKRVEAMILKDLFLMEQFNCHSKYREIFLKCEKKMEKIFPIKQISDFSQFIISCQDIEILVAKRKENYLYLKENLSAFNIFPAISLEIQDCPFTLPILVKDRDLLRSFLIENHIYCAVHWPKDDYMDEQRENAKFFAEHLLSLPIDQRYGRREMDYLLSALKRFGGEIQF